MNIIPSNIIIQAPVSAYLLENIGIISMADGTNVKINISSIAIQSLEIPERIIHPA